MARCYGRLLIKYRRPRGTDSGQFFEQLSEKPRTLLSKSIGSCNFGHRRTFQGSLLATSSPHHGFHTNALSLYVKWD